MRRVVPSLCFLFCVNALPMLAEEEQPQAAGGREKKSEEDDSLARFRIALRVVGSSAKATQLTQAMDQLRDGYPDSRPVLLEALRSEKSRIRACALQILGEKGETATDLEIVAVALKDRDARVRLAAITAVRRLGKEGFQVLLHHLLSEEAPNNRKMTIKALQEWGDHAAVPYIARLLETEENSGVKNFAFTALRVISGRDLGRDVAAWKAYAEDWVEKERARLYRATKSCQASDAASP